MGEFDCLQQVCCLECAYGHCDVILTKSSLVMFEDQLEELNLLQKLSPLLCEFFRPLIGWQYTLVVPGTCWHTCVTRCHEEGRVLILDSCERVVHLVSWVPRVHELVGVCLHVDVGKG